MKKSFAAIVIGLCCFLGMRAEGVVILAHDDFEGGSAGYAKGGFQSVGVTNTADNVRTGTYALDYEAKTGTSEAESKRSNKLTYVKNTYVHIISWVKADSQYKMRWAANNSNGTQVTLGGDDNWHRLTWKETGYHYTSSDAAKDNSIKIQPKVSASGKHIYVNRSAYGYRQTVSGKECRTMPHGNQMDTG